MTPGDDIDEATMAVELQRDAEADEMERMAKGTVISYERGLAGSGIKVETVLPDDPMVTFEEDVEKYFWWCPECKAEVDGSRVTYQEHHDSCGQIVQAIEVKNVPLAAEVARLRLLNADLLASWALADEIRAFVRT